MSGTMRIRQIKEIEIPDLPQKIKAARIAMAEAPEPGKKTMEDICREVGLSRTYWYDIEQDRLRGTLSIENLRKIEAALKIDLGVKFDD